MHLAWGRGAVPPAVAAGHPGHHRSASPDRAPALAADLPAALGDRSPAYYA
ncbi:MAG TPA: hypothetical protein VKY26_00360 [Actinomycetota bacterium]|nr:hypothetical protein [Actinomycetota bacterium]